MVWCGDSHYGRVEAMDWADDNDTDYVFGLPGNRRIARRVIEQLAIRCASFSTPSRC
jgi:hypothetical protein